MTHSYDPIQACRTTIAKTVQSPRASIVGFSLDVDGHIPTNNMTAKTTHICTTTVQASVPRDTATQKPRPYKLLCRVQYRHPRALWRTATTPSHSTSKTQRHANQHNCNKRHHLPLSRRQCHTTQRHKKQGPHDLQYTYREHLD